MGDPNHGHDEALVSDREENPVAALTNAVLVGPRELLTTGRTRVVGQRLDALHDASPVLSGGDRLDLFDGRGLDKKPITCHAA